MTDTQEAMREEFERVFVTPDTIHWDADQQAYRPNNPYMDDHVEIATRQTEKLYGWQAATAQSAEKIARLESEAVVGHNLFAQQLVRADNLERRLAAAELSNNQLREEVALIRAIVRHPRHLNEEELAQLKREAAQIAEVADRALAQQPSTEALDAYVAKLIPPGWKVVPVKLSEEMRDKMKDCEDGRYFVQEAWEYILSAAPIPPAPEKG